MSFASSTVTVTVSVFPVSVLVVPLDADTVEWLALTAPGVSVTVAGLPMAVPFRVPVMCAVPASAGAVNVAL